MLDSLVVVVVAIVIIDVFRFWDKLVVTLRLLIQGVSKKSEFSGNWLRKILLGSVRNPVGIIMTNPALLQYVSHFIILSVWVTYRYS